MKKMVKYILFFVGIIIILLLVIWKNMNEKSDTKIISSSVLKDAVNVSELSTAKFTYNGIVAVYKDKNKDDVECYVKYDATVKVYIDISEVEFDIDRDNRVVKPILPEVRIKLGTVDEKSFSFIPENTELKYKDVLKACEEDVEKEAQKSKMLKELSKKNLKSIVEALIIPIIEQKGYSINWE